VSIKRRRAWWDILCMLVKCRKLWELHFAAGAPVEPPSVLEIIIYILAALVTFMGYIINVLLSSIRRATSRLQMD
jgi:hypothetical protein